MPDPDYILDLGGTKPPPPPNDEAAAPGPAATGRPFISVHFECCNVYARVYRNAAATAYVGWCPRCARKVTAVIAPDGTDARTFRAR